MALRQQEAHRPRRRQGPWLALALGAGISLLAGIAVPIALGSLAVSGVDSLIVALALTLLAGITALIYAERRRLISLPVFTGVALLGYPVGALAYALGWQGDVSLIPVFSASAENRVYLLWALALVAGGLAAWLVGYHLLGAARIGRKAKDAVAEDASPPDVAPVDRGRLRKVVAGYTLVGALGLALYFRGQGGLQQFLDQVAYLRVIPVGSFYLSWVALLLPVASLLWLGADEDHARRSPLFWALFGLSFLALLSTGSRWAPGGYLLIAALTYYQRHGSWRRIAATFCALGLAVITLSMAIGAWRAISFEISDVSLAALTTRTLGMLSPRDVLSLFVEGRNGTDVDLLAWTLKNYSWDNLLWGRTALDIPLMVVPRSLWPGKPTELGMRLFQEYTGWADVTNAWHPGMVGELYANCHAFGVIIGMMLLGLASARVDRWRASHLHEPATALLYAVFAVKFALMGIIIGLMMPTIELSLYAIPLAFGIRLLHRRAEARTGVINDAHRH